MKPIFLLFIGVLGLTACVPAEPRYVVGEAYRMGGVWSYPKEDFALVETGLAEILPMPVFAGQTANGEALTGTGLTGAHRSLQLPAIVRVTNLENGRSLLLRVNDRGPERRGRILGVSARAAALLGMAPGRATRISLAVDADRSRAAIRGLPGSEPSPINIAAAPRGAVAREELAPPPGGREAPRREVQSLPGVTPAQMELRPARPVIEALPETVLQGAARPGLLMIDAGQFSRRDAADQLARRLPSARVRQLGAGRSAVYAVRLGPFADVPSVDLALEQTLAAGVSGAKIVID